MKKYKASLTINGERSEGEGELSFADGKAILSAVFPDGEKVDCVVFTPETNGCVMEKRGELPIFSRFIPGERTEMVCDSPYGRVLIPVLTLRCRCQLSEESAMIWLSYVVLYGEEGGEQDDAEETGEIPSDLAAKADGTLKDAALDFAGETEEETAKVAPDFMGEEGASLTGEKAMPADLEEDAFFGGKFSVLFTLKRKDPVC